jgi:hypothetical protein
MLVGQVKSINMLETPENSGMPKSENSTLAVNQQGRPLSYIVGVYFGDGTTSPSYSNGKRSDKKMFRLIVIDRDFRDYTAECCEIAFPERKVTRFEQFNSNGKKAYGLQVAGYGNYLESITGKKVFIPNFVYRDNETRSAFVEGLLDSEGWVQLTVGKRATSVSGHIGFAITSEIIHELKKIMDSLNIQTGKTATYTKNRKLALKQLNVNIKSFINSGLVFHCGRKQTRIEAFRLILKTVEAAQRISRDILAGSLRDLTIDSITEMIKSELHGDMERLSEMNSPVLN